MPYEPVTPAQFVEAKPQFADVDPVVIQSYLDTAALFVDENWPEKFYQPAIIAVTCHLMTIDGMGTDPSSQSYADGTSSYQSIRSGDFSLTRFRDSAQNAGMSTSAWFSQTACGQMYLLWVRMFFSGPRVVGGCLGDPISGYAKDYCYRDSWWP